VRAWTVAGAILTGVSAGNKDKLSIDAAVAQHLEPFSPAMPNGPSMEKGQGSHTPGEGNTSFARAA